MKGAYFYSRDRFHDLKTPITRPLCLQTSFTFYRVYTGYHVNPISQKIPILCVSWPRIEFIPSTVRQFCQKLSKNPTKTENTVTWPVGWSCWPWTFSTWWTSSTRWTICSGWRCYWCRSRTQTLAPPRYISPREFRNCSKKVLIFFINLMVGFKINTVIFLCYKTM